MPTTDNYFAESAAYIAAVLKMLNSANLPDPGPGSYYIAVTLMDDDHKKRGFFSDEIGSDAWYYQPEVFGGAA